MVLGSDKTKPACVSDTVQYFSAEVLYAYDYSPFGAILPGRQYVADTSCSTVIDYDTAYNDHYNITFAVSTLLSPGQNIRIQNAAGTTKILATYNAAYVHPGSYLAQIGTNVSPANDGIQLVSLSYPFITLRFSADSLGFACGNTVTAYLGGTSLTSVSIDCAVDSIYAVDTFTTCSSSDYRFGFTGQEKDNEVSGAGNTIAFEARIFDTRLGRFFSTDPLEDLYPYQSTYVFAHNSPISLIDWKGMGDPPVVQTKTGDAVKQGEGPSAYATRNGVTLDELASLNPEVFKNYPTNGSAKEKKTYWDNLNGKNWSIHPGQLLVISKCEVPATVTLETGLTFEHVESTDALWGLIINEGQQAYTITYNLLLRNSLDENGEVNSDFDFEITNIKRTWTSHSLNLRAYTALLTELTALKILRAIKPAPKELTSSQLGKIIGWGEGQSLQAVQQTINVTQNLTKAQVRIWARQGLTKKWVQDQLQKYTASVAKGGAKLNNTQLMHRKELMEKILDLW